MNAVKTINASNSVKSISILIILLCVGILLSCSGGDVSGPEWNITTGGFKDSDPEFTVDKTVVEEIPVENRHRIIVEAKNGEVVVTGQADVQNVTVTAHLSVGSDTKEDAQLHLDDIDVLVSDDDNEILIQTIQPKNINGRKYLVEYDIIVPNSFEVVASQTNGSMAILDIHDRVEVTNENGDVLLSGIVGGITADVENGGIEGTVVLPFNETIDLSVNNGGLELSLPKSTSAEFSASVTGVGEIIVSDLDMTDSLRTSVSLTGTLGNGEGSIVLTTVNGNIAVIGFD